MPELPRLSDLPAENLARLRALNPELMDELQPQAAPERADPMVALAVEMEVARQIAAHRLWATYQIQPVVPPPPPKDDGGGLVFRWAGATIAGLYIFYLAGAFG